MTEIIPNSYSLQINWDEKYAVTLCARPGCGAELRTPFIHSGSRETLQHKHDKEYHFFTATKVVGKTTYNLGRYADDPELGKAELEDNFESELALFSQSKLPSTSFVKRASSPWKRPQAKKELYKPTGVMVGSQVTFARRDRPIYDEMGDYLGTAPPEYFTGQVWSEAGPREYSKSMWVVTDDQRAFVVHKETLNVLMEW